MTSVEDVTQEDAKAWELLQQQRADAALAAKAAEEFASQARAQVRSQSHLFRRVGSTCGVCRAARAGRAAVRLRSV